MRMPAATLRAWVCGQKNFEPVILLDHESRPPLLSFMNLVEAHVLSAIRKVHQIPLQKVRIALNTLVERFPPTPHPLASHRFETDGADLFIRTYGDLVNLSRPDQEFMREVITLYLQRIKRDERLIPYELYPVTNSEMERDRCAVMVNPQIAFGRLVIAGTGIPTRTVADRYAAGESIDELAQDYRRDRLDIEDAIRCELELQAA